MKKGKVVLVGTGFVGMSMAYSMLNKGGVNELILIDIDKDKTIGEEMDLSHGLPFAPQKMVIKAGDYSDCKDAQVVVITAGIAQKPGQTRLELAEVNTKIMKQITESIMKSRFDGIIIVASNPVDLMTYVVAEVSGLPKNRVIGSGTVLDTARLRSLLGKYLGIDGRNVQGYVLGEHGDSEFVTWSSLMVGSIPVKSFSEQNSITWDEGNETVIAEDVKNCAYEVIKRKGATAFSVAIALTRIVEAIIRDEKSILTVSTLLNDYYGVSDAYLSVPTILGKNGIEKVVELKLNAAEKEAFAKSAAAVHKTNAALADALK